MVRGVRELSLAGLGALAPLTGALAQSMGIHPGQWESQVTVTSIETPNAPPALIDAMRGKTHTLSHCITPEQAARGPQEMLKSGTSCSFTRYSMAAGRLSARMQCAQGAGSVSADIDGSFTPDSYSSTSRVVLTGRMAMTMTSSAVGHRTGDCRK